MSGTDIASCLRAYDWRQMVSAKDKETPNMRRKILPFILGGALAVAAVGPAAASHGSEHRNAQLGGAAGLVAAVVQLQDVNVSVIEADRSLNNLLRNADIDVLNNVLNNTLRNADIIDDITLENILNENDVVVGIAVLSAGVPIGTIDL